MAAFFMGVLLPKGRCETGGGDREQFYWRAGVAVSELACLASGMVMPKSKAASLVAIGLFTGLNF
ncbi:hypothetical protein [Marinobacter salicampi]|uniref:hypothetical protein n=1 Tax=Marinobacter salicampi TaxID=435907 RepID=UPI00140C494F|nr:hypothetical protein [Marinobacter salicampi]